MRPHLSSEHQAVLHICITCRTKSLGSHANEPLPPEGLELWNTLQSLYAHLADKPPFILRAVQCLGVCDKGCSAAMCMEGKWSYLLGNLSSNMAADLLDYASLYAGSKTGTLMPSKRPASLGESVLGRIPSLTQFS